VCVYVGVTRGQVEGGNPSIAVCCGVLQCIVVCCSVLQRVAVCCGVLQCATESSVLCRVWKIKYFYLCVCVDVTRGQIEEGNPSIAVCCSVLQRVAACCSELQRVAACHRKFGRVSSEKIDDVCVCVGVGAKRRYVDGGNPLICCNVLQCVAEYCSALCYQEICCGSRVKNKVFLRVRLCRCTTWTN